MTRFVLVYFILFQSVFAHGQAIDFASQISSDSIHSYLIILTSDSLEGRETGRPGQKKAALYLEKLYRSWEIPAHLQKHPLSVRANSGLNLVINGHYLIYYQDFYYAPNKVDTVLNAENIFVVGFGISQPTYSDYSKKDIFQKNILVSWGQPHWKKKFKNEKFRPTQSETLKEFISFLSAMSPSSIFISVDSIPSIISQIESDEMLMKEIQESPIPIIFLNRNSSENFFPNETQMLYDEYLRKIEKKTKPNPISQKTDIYLKLIKNTNQLVGENVIAFLEGDNSQECLIISSHYDHLGILDSLIYPGADDDGSGTSAILEMARNFAKAKREGYQPKRSIIFLNFSGEEKGLFGSKFYVKHPDIPLVNCLADLNIDMVGRIDPKHDSLNVRDYIYVIGAGRLSKDLEAINDEMNDRYTKLELDNTYELPGDVNRFYERSDHYSFAKNGVPIIFYFNGTHSDYHKPTDTVDKINFVLLKKRAELVFLTAWELVNRKERIKLNNQ